MTRTDACACRPILPDPTALSSKSPHRSPPTQDAEAPHPLAYLAAVLDPQAARGRRHPLAAIQPGGRRGAGRCPHCLDRSSGLPSPQ